MKFVLSLLCALAAPIALTAGAVAASADECEVPASLLSSENDLTHVAAAVKDQHRLDIVVLGTASSALAGPGAAAAAYPAQLETALKALLPGVEIKVITHIRPRTTTAEMAAGLEKILADEKPELVIWQAGTADAVQGVAAEDFGSSLDAGLNAIQAAGADAILVNMQYSPRIESMLEVSTYADVMHWAAQQHSVPLFDRLGIMRYWNDEGTFDLYAATKDYVMARNVHKCIGKALASQIINAAHLDSENAQTTH